MTEMIDGKQVYTTIGYYATKEEGLLALDDDNFGSIVYFISDGEFVKIGKADNVEKRLKTLQTGNPKPLKILKTIPCNSAKEAYDLEFFFHALLKDHKSNGEWYKL